MLFTKMLRKVPARRQREGQGASLPGPFIWKFSDKGVPKWFRNEHIKGVVNTS
jgi:hypothetical protein